ncbi:receptor-like protein kinase BRI1-like 3 [Sorghum bicolor]|uniref:receptor-like protein kinase BRI1-like 3 n=1 Tax=Sorghum bicolor TaxID=4558 RepID=UPI00081AE178|nr:receptor-like protein kinase BRI1-like 3 [Sorghum bicolor]|eukprot:XP_021319970.1 receptor-like protein kinase BRI1-like 3 [Sorghum bicolor]
MHPRSNPLPILLTIIGTILFITGGAGGQPHGGSGVCITTERAALLSFKKGITSDPANLLASWRGQDCCQWRGIRCNNKTGHVTKLQLRNPNPYMSALSGVAGRRASRRKARVCGHSGRKAVRRTQARAVA